MLLKGEQLASHLERDLRLIYVLHGDEPLLVLEAADAVRAAAVARGYTEREVLTALPGFNWSELAAMGCNLSLFGDRKLIDLRLPGGKPGKEGSAALQQWCAAPNPDNLLLVTLPELDWREEKASWFAALTQAGVVVRLNAPPSGELPAWIGARLRRQKQSAADDALVFMAERVEGNLLAAHQEISKLALLYPAGPLSLAQVREAVLNVARYDIDDLREALLLGDVARLVRTLDGLRHEGEAPPLVLWALCEEIRALNLVKAQTATGRPVDTALKDAKVWGPRQQRFKRLLPRLPLERLNQALHHAARVDQLVKGFGRGDVWEEMLRLCLCLQPLKAKN